jgi:hypothetical protein
VYGSPVVVDVLRILVESLFVLSVEGAVIMLVPLSWRSGNHTVRTAFCSV